MEMMDNDTLELQESIVEELATDTLSAKCILFDDDWHTFEEVIDQIVKATKCSKERAERHTMEVHYNGKSIVYTGDLGRCLSVSSILEEISLRTNVEC